MNEESKMVDEVEGEIPESTVVLDRSQYLLIEILRDSKVIYSKWSKAIIPIFHWMIELSQDGDTVLISSDSGTAGQPNRKVLYEIKVGP